jgi:hypothetical protein
VLVSSAISIIYIPQFTQNPLLIEYILWYQHKARLNNDQG